jgi:hypothetical protein
MLNQTFFADRMKKQVGRPLSIDQSGLTQASVVLAGAALTSTNDSHTKEMLPTV